MNKCKAMAILLSVALLTSTAVSCKSGESGSSYTEDYTWSDEKLTYTFYGSQPIFTNTSKDKVIQTIEEKFNVTIKLNYSTEWESRLSTIVNSNKNVPDVLFAIPDGTSFPMWAEKGYIVPFNNYLDKLEADGKAVSADGTSNLKTLLSAEHVKNAAVGGQYYFAPQMTGVSNHVLIVRKDWMRDWAVSKDKAEDYYPVTLSEFTDMLTYFHTENKGNYSDGTFGLGLNENFDFTEDFLSAFGISPSYTKKEDGTYVLSAQTAEYDDYIEWLNNGTSEGYIYPYFGGVTESTTADNFKAGKIGAFVTTCNYTLTNMIATMETDYKTEATFIPFPSSDDGKYVGSPVGDQYYWGGYCVSVNAKEPYRLLAILDYMMGEEGQELLTWGVEGTYYTKNEDGTRTITEENFANRNADGGKSLFITPNNYDMSASAAYGEYNLGTAISPLKFKVENGKVKYNTPYELMYNGGAEQKRYDEYVTGLEEAGNVNWRQPEFLIDKYKISTISIACLDYAKTYTIQAACGSKDKIDSFKTEMERSCSSKGLDSVLKYLSDSAK